MQEGLFNDIDVNNVEKTQKLIKKKRMNNIYPLDSHIKDKRYAFSKSISLKST